VWDKQRKEWVDWADTRAEAYTVDTSAPFNEIAVPTSDSIRMQYLTRLLLTHQKHVLCPGPTGTGKTVNIQALLTYQLPEEY